MKFTLRRRPLRALDQALNARSSFRDEDDKEVELVLYGVIGWEVLAAEVRRDLSLITAETIHVRLNSYGGDVFDGVAIYNALRAHDATVIVHIDGLAASIASLIALAGDRIEIAANAHFMVHHPWTFAAGNKHELRKLADELEKIGNSSLRTTLAERSGKSEEEIEKLLDAETWFDAAEAKEAGFVDAIAGDSEEDAGVDDRILEIFDHVPEKLRARAAAEPRSADPKRAIERVLRDAGLGRVAAKAFVAGGLKELESTSGTLGREHLQNSLRQLITTLS